MNGKTIKTVEVAPTWESALNICVWALENTLADLRSKHAKDALQHRINALRDTFLPLCRSIDAKNAEIRAAKEAEAAKETPVVCSGCADTLPCGHGAEVNDEGRCVLCGGEGEI